MLRPLRRIIKRVYVSGIFKKINPVAGRNFVFATGFVLLVLYNGFTFFANRRLQSERKLVTDAYVKLIETRLIRDSYAGFDSNELRGFLRKIALPVIITDSLWEPLLWENIRSDDIFNSDGFPVDRLPTEQYEYLKKKIVLFRNTSKPYPLYLENGHMQYLLLGNNRFTNMLAFMPYIEVTILVVFFGLSYVVFHNVKLTERSNLWVGLAKETAHQLGTPISSLMGWVEYMRTIHEADPPIEPQEFMSQVEKICDDMDNDLKRLRIVTARFSQIGSIPTLQEFDTNMSLKDVADYFRVRLPLLRKKIDIKLNFGTIPPAYANKDLMEWVFENIMKNAIDAIHRNDGLIEIRTEFIQSEKIVRVHYIDNGKGISREIQAQIFTPGFTTKKRGWGLGLTLAKRIVEEYHNGRVYVEWSQKDKGTAFCIDLPSASGQIIV